MNLYLKAELLESKEQVKQPSPSVMPDNQLSFKLGIIQKSKGDMIFKFFFINFSLKNDKKVKKSKKFKKS